MRIANELQRPLAAISGGLGDIGQAIARGLKNAGAEVALCDLSSGEGRTFTASSYDQVDVRDAAAVESWFGSVTEKFGRAPNIIVPNAATATFRRHLEITPDGWKQELDVNLNGAFYFAEAGARRLTQAAQAGRIVFIGSWAGHAPHAHLPAYSASKAALRMLTKTLALELAGRGILVNEVAPGYVDAGLSGRAFAANPDLAVEATNKVPIRKLISADEVAAQVLYLCSAAGNHLTGTTILMDGGLSLLQGPFTE
jgi:glucose 1-dehydrogenase